MATALRPSRRRVAASGHPGSIACAEAHCESVKTSRLRMEARWERKYGRRSDELRIRWRPGSVVGHQAFAAPPRQLCKTTVGQSQDEYVDDGSSAQIHSPSSHSITRPILDMYPSPSMQYALGCLDSCLLWTFPSSQIPAMTSVRYQGP